MELGGIILIGLISALTVNYLADVLPLFRKFAPPVCLECHNPFKWGRYILMQSCSQCGARRKIRASLLIIVFPLFMVWMWLYPPARTGFWLGWVVLVYFSLVAVIDIEYRAILHPVSAFGAVIGLAVGVNARSLLDTLIGGFAGAGIMLVLYYFGIAFIRILSKIRKQEIDEIALGFGDVILGGILGLTVGWPEIIGAIFTAIMIAGLVSALMILVSLALKRYKALVAIPYAPFLLLGAAIFLFIPK